MLQDHKYAASAFHGMLVYAPAFTGSHCPYLWRYGLAEWTSVAGYKLRWFARPKTATHLSTNWTRCWVTLLIETNALTLGQTSTDY